MKHPSTRTVFSYWDRQRGVRPAPERADIDPADIRHALGDTIMLVADYTDAWRFRLAGTRVCALIGRELKGEAFTALWSEESRSAIEELIAVIDTEKSGAVAGVTATTEDRDEADLELLVLPLGHGGAARVRALGVLTPLMPPPYWLGAKPVCELTLHTLRHLGPAAKTVSARGFAATRLSDTRKRHGLVLLPGGRETAAGKRTG